MVLLHIQNWKFICPILFIQQQQSWCCAHVPQALAPASPQRRGWFSAHQLQRTCPHGGTSWNTEWRVLTAVLWRTTSAPLGTYLFPALLCDHRLVWDVRILLAFRHEILETTGQSENVKRVKPSGVCGVYFWGFRLFEAPVWVRCEESYSPASNCWVTDILCCAFYQPDNKPSTEMTRCRNCW